MTEIDVKVIKGKLNSILDYLVSEGMESFSVDSSMYWATPMELDADFGDRPELDIGDLGFDMDMVSKIEQPLAWELTYFPQLLVAIAQAGAKRSL